MKPLRYVFLPLLLSLCLLSASCGYRNPFVYMGPTQNIYLANWKNRTGALQLNADIHRSLLNWYQKNDSLRVVRDRSNPDIILAGEIISIELPSLSYGADNTAREVKVRLTVRYILKHMPTKKTLLEVPRETFTEEHTVTGNAVETAENESDALDTIIDELSQKIYLATIEKLSDMQMQAITENNEKSASSVGFFPSPLLIMLQIANIRLASPFLLAPLAGYSDLPFRLLCREFGACLCVSEMISCHGLVYAQEKTLEMTRTVPEERPVALQLFGADPVFMGRAAAILKGYSPELIDINMGCPVKKVVKKGAGAALMREPALAAKIIKKVVREGGLPVTVKFRAGWDNTERTAVSFAKMAEEAGASALIIHGRTRAQGFQGEADWRIVEEVKESVSLPVIGNGDILTRRDGAARMRQTGCDGVMIGRGAIGNPWIFQEEGKPREAAAITEVVFRHLDLMQRDLPANRFPGRIKNHIGRYFKGLPGSAKIRKDIYNSASFQELRAVLSRLHAEENSMREGSSG